VQISRQTYTEEELVFSLKQKDEVAFSYLYDNYNAALNGVVYAMVNDFAIAEDILQEAFLKIWNNIHAYDATKGKLYTWMRKITHNLTLDTLKSNQHKYQKKVLGDEMVVANVSVSNSVFSKMEAADFRKKLDALDQKQRTIIDMSYFQGYTQEEIAVALGMPVGTVKTKIRSAIIELRKILN
jgi:RNA polymerase sigma factor (sigma-70 family)